MTTTLRQPTLYISHGGGPWPYMEGDFRRKFTQLEASLKKLPTQLPAPPSALLMISAHWQTQTLSVMSNPNPPMVYDYSGFPQHTYQVQYPAPGAPELAERTQQLLSDSGLQAVLDPHQGYDHGTFAPMAVSYPKADIPIVQLSIQQDYEPATHLAIGRAIAPLRDEGILIIGSGLSYHNLRNFGENAKESSKRFDDWLQKSLCHSTADMREQCLLNWERAPSARDAHPNEDHLIPLLVSVGAAYADPGNCIYHEEDFFGGITASSFRFG